MLRIYDLTVEYKTNPVGLDETQPRFSWKLDSDNQNTYQSAYQITVSNDELLWDSGKVESNSSILIDYMGKTFTPCTLYTWIVTVYDNHGEQASASASFETGLLNGLTFQGKAKWITHSFEASSTIIPEFTKAFNITKPVKQARLYASALGIYEASLNGEKVDNTYFAPGWTS